LPDKPRSGAWTEEKDKALLYGWPIKKKGEVAHILGFSMIACGKRYTELITERAKKNHKSLSKVIESLPRSNRLMKDVKWTKQLDDILLKNWETVGKMKMCLALGLSYEACWKRFKYLVEEKSETKISTKRNNKKQLGVGGPDGKI
jgi:hypothetical protein